MKVNGNLELQGTGGINVAQTNILINGGFEIWQRGISFTNPASSSYSVDRWKMSYFGGTILNINREAITVKTNSKYSCRIDVTTIGTYYQLEQLIENIEEFRGKTISFSCWVNSSIANKVKLRIYDGTYTDSSLNDGTSWERLTVTKTISNSATTLLVAIWQDTAGTTTTVYIDNAMAVIGSQFANFIPKLPSIELEDCQRYYEKSCDEGDFFGDSIFKGEEHFHLAKTNIGVGETWGSNTRFKVTKRTAPAIRIWTRTGVTGSIRNFTATANYISNIADVGINGCLVQNNSGSVAGTAGDLCGFQWDADAEI